MNKLGTGGGSNKLVSPNIRTGSLRKGSSPGAADQIGQTVAFRKDQIDAQRGYNASQLGNAVALNSKSAPGQGRTTHPCGSQGTFGPVNPGNSVPARDILSSFGPERRKG